MGAGKTSKSEQKLELPPEMEEQAKKNIELANQVAKIPYAPNFGPQVAAFSPAQNAAFGNTNAAAQAFGLQGSQGTGLPTPQNIGGISGYGTRDLYTNAQNQMDPGTRKMIEDMFSGAAASPPVGTNNPAQQLFPPGMVRSNGSGRSRGGWK